MTEYLKDQHLTCVLTDDGWWCLQGLQVRLADKLGGPLDQSTSRPAAQPEFYRMFMGGGNRQS
jgi:hypothetical protein